MRWRQHHAPQGQDIPCSNVDGETCVPIVPSVHYATPTQWQRALTCKDTGSQANYEIKEVPAIYQGYGQNKR